MHKKRFTKKKRIEIFCVLAAVTAVSLTCTAAAASARAPSLFEGSAAVGATGAESPLSALLGIGRRKTVDVKFAEGYPKLSERGGFSAVSVEIKTDAPCDVYYGIAEHGKPYLGEYGYLCEIIDADAAVRAEIRANLSDRYDIYIKTAVNGEFRGKTAVIKNVLPFSIASGDGSEESPYIIYSERQLLDIACAPSACYRLENDIVTDGEWSALPSFSGVLDGNGYKISGITVNDDGETGLFTEIDGGTVKNLAVSAEVSSGNTAGIIAGTNNGKITGCTVCGSVSVRTNNGGGICGINNGEISDCLSAAYSVSAGSFAGGIAGQNYGVVKNCLSACEAVASDMYAGGISGANSGGEIDTCVSACTAVYDTMTLNSGRLTTNKKGGITVNGYCYDDTVSNAAYCEENEFSQNGFDTPWEKLCDINFYLSIGWDAKKWVKPTNGYTLICPKKCAPAELEPGKTAYFPKTISNEAELRAVDKNEAGHYILSCDIYLTAPWKTICTQNGFSGTLDGNGYTVYNINLKGQPGMFSNITGGTVKNLTLRSASATGSGGAVIAACNYGYIRGCEVFGEVNTKKSGMTGIVAGENYGEISDCRVNADIVNTCDNAVIGGICAENNGMVTGAVFSGTIRSDGKNAVTGGICGNNIGGYLFESFSSSEIKADNDSSYAGGICGISSGGQVYKCAADGRIVADGKQSVYAGGICGLTENAVVYNCYSLADLHISGKDGFTGGIAGCNSGSNIQNTYCAANIVAAHKSNAGGICGYSEDGFVMQNAVICPSVSCPGSVGAVVGAFENGDVSDNYCCEKTIINSKRVSSSAHNGIVKPLSAFKGNELYFKDLSYGGCLGWDDNAWSKSGSYPFPILTEVSGQESLRVPSYK